jgi:UDP-N-acetylmuramoyl-tripeptide--D-alanyl-D-alanine ligase
LRWKDTFYSLNVPLFGLHHTDNIGLAFATACTMGIEPQIVINALKTVPQIPHRLEVKKLNKGYLIDDAYNSNPLGFRSALDLLFLVGKKRRKILITPGMVELGGAHDEIHYQIGGLAAESCDICIVIKPKRIKTFVQGFKEKSRGNQMLLEMESFAQAQEWLDDNIQDKDLVLIENDLPDIYERIPRL